MKKDYEKFENYWLISRRLLLWNDKNSKTRTGAYKIKVCKEIDLINEILKEREAV